MLRAAIYARFSTDLQSERSTDDQITLCRTYADREGYQVVAAYEDKAKSGASIFGRDGLQQLLADAANQKFDVIIVEAIDRLARDMEDLAGMHKRMSFLGIKILAVHEGEANTVLVGLRGLVSQLFREDNAHKVRRGLSGRVKQGLSAGGKAYGYRPDPLKKGELVIDHDEAAIVQRIFREYASGKSPRAIARDLNRDKIAPPRGRTWSASTLNGSASRHNGLLRNPIYGGTLIWNRVRMVKDPNTGKRVSRINPKDQWEVVEKPELRIIDEVTFAKVQARKEETAHEPHFYKQRRPKHLFSGLLKCGCCGSGMVTTGTDKSGRKRIRCSGFSQRGICDKPRTYYLNVVEDLILDTLRNELQHPEVISAYVQEYHAERKRLELQRTKSRAQLEQRLAAVEAEAKRILDIVVKTDTPPDFALSRLQELSAEKKQISADIAETPEAEKIVSLHPTALAFYEKQLQRLGRYIGDTIAEGDLEAAQVIRDIVSKIVIIHDDSEQKGRFEKSAFTVEIHGDLTRLLGPETEEVVVIGISGSGGGIRTPDTRIMIPLL